MTNAHATRASTQVDVHRLASSASQAPDGDAPVMPTPACLSPDRADPDELAVILACLYGELVQGLSLLLRLCTEVRRG